VTGLLAALDTRIATLFNPNDHPAREWQTCSG